MAGFCQSRSVIIYPKEANIIFNSTFSLNQFKTAYKSTEGRDMTKMQIDIDRPAHIYYIRSFVKKNTSIVMNNYSLLVMPGDSIVLDQEKPIRYRYNNYIDSLISMKWAYNFNDKEAKALLAKIGLPAFIKLTEDTYRDNEKKIVELKLDKSLSSFNYIVKCKVLTDLFKETGEENRKIFDSLYGEMIANYKEIDKINSPFSFSIFYKLIVYKMAGSVTPENQLWDQLEKAPRLPFLQRMLLLSLYGSNEAGPKLREQRFEKIKKAKLSDAKIDSVYRAMKNRSPLLENIVLSNQTELKFVTKDGKTLTLTNILSKHKEKLLLIDFWASWCVPCRAEFPSFKRMRAKFKDQPIAFLNMSIDLDNKNKEWKTALVEEKELSNPNQYRMVDWKNSELTRLLSLRTIPRYILMDNAGTILNSDFLRPSDARFEEELKKYINRLKVN